MDLSQKEHCKAYGVMYNSLQKGIQDAYWLLNYRGGSFLLPAENISTKLAENAGISFELISESVKTKIFTEIDNNNMDAVLLEKAPKIALYLESKQYSDVVKDVLNYANIPFETIYDKEILDNDLSNFDWLHIHHKDFTGQRHKTPGQFLLAQGPKGYKHLWELKHKVSQKIKNFVANGGFVFAMCSAAETFDISLAANGIDIVPSRIDGTPVADNYQEAINYKNGFAFTNYQILPDSREYSDIDVPSAGKSQFKLFEFSATVDAIPCLLNQNHQNVINGFYGETTAFRKSLVKKSVTILAENNDGASVKYLCGYYQKGIFAYYGGHTPGNGEQAYKKYAPAFRLILNNVLFPAAKIKKRKT